MSSSKSSLILYPHQLYPAEHLPQADTVLLVEEPLLFGVDQEYRQRIHKQKLIFMRATMRRYVEEVLWPAGYKVDYIELDVFMQTRDLLEKVRKFDRVSMFDPSNEILATRILQARRELGEDAPTIEFMTSPNFYLSEQEVRQYFTQRHKHPFEEFYQWQRERFNILLTEDYKPVGGSWLLKQSAKKPTEPAPGFGVFGANKWVDEATEYVNKHFPDNPGSTDFIWPTSHQEAAQWLNSFLSDRLDSYGQYAGYIDSDAIWLYHGALSTSLNAGLLDPEQVINAALDRHAKKPVPLESLELLIRNILGWREFTRGVALVGGGSLRTSNPLKAQRRLTNAWYDGTTGLPPFDTVVKKLLAKGYVSHAERQLVIGTLMTVCDIRPSDVYQWCNELFIDAHDWALLPYVYGLSQFADNSSLDGGPYVVPSKAIIDSSNYSKGEWCNVWDGLYWRFIESHKTILKKNSRMRSAVQRLERLDPDQKRIVSYRAEDFLRTYTQ